PGGGTGGGSDPHGANPPNPCAPGGARLSGAGGRHVRRPHATAHRAPAGLGGVLESPCPPRPAADAAASGHRAGAGAERAYSSRATPARYAPGGGSLRTDSPFHIPSGGRRP